VQPVHQRKHPVFQLQDGRHPLFKTRNTLHMSAELTDVPQGSEKTDKHQQQDAGEDELQAPANPQTPQTPAARRLDVS
jgi:hypothetical protein